jgi:hypothetical protein
MLFNLVVVFYKNRRFNFPTTIKISSCAYDPVYGLEKPYSLPTLETPYITTDPCECEETSNSQ